MGGALALSPSGDLNIPGNLVVRGDAAVSRSLTASRLNATGAATAGSLSVAGSANLSSASVGSLAVRRDATLAGKLEAGAVSATNLTATGQVAGAALAVTGPGSFGSLQVSGGLDAQTVTAAASLASKGSLSAVGTATLRGASVFGDLRVAGKSALGCCTCCCPVVGAGPPRVVADPRAGGWQGSLGALTGMQDTSWVLKRLLLSPPAHPPTHCPRASVPQARSAARRRPATTAPATPSCSRARSP